MPHRLRARLEAHQARLDAAHALQAVRGHLLGERIQGGVRRRLQVRRQPRQVGARLCATWLPCDYSHPQACQWY